MQEREFEKQVQEKMQELRFAPGTEVWAQVQARIQKKKRRRPVVFWILFAGLLIGGSSIIYLTGEKSTGKNIVHMPAPGAAKQAPVAATQTPAATQQQSSVPTQQPITTQKNHVSINSYNPNTTHNSVIPQKSSISKKRTTKSTPLLQSDPEITPITQTPQANLQEKPAPVTPQEPLATADPNSATNKPAPKETGIAMENKPVKKENKKENKNNDWQWGISAGAGISDLGMQLFKSTSVVDFAYNSPGGAAVPPNQPNSGAPSEINPAAAWQLGGYVSKSISKKLALKAGLNYEYYSNTISVGAHYNSQRAINQGATMNIVDQYYDRGNESRFTNKYHFVSLPLSMQWKLNKNPKQGIVWENGISLARMVGANALHYDGISGTYYEDDNLFNKTQWIASSSLLFTIKSKNKVQLYAGPQLQYGISNIVDGSTGNNNHLRYAGLKIMAGFNKK